MSPTGGVLRSVEPGPRPSRLERFNPTPEMEMENLGYTLGRDGEEARAPKRRSFPELVAFYGGWLAGKADLEAEFNEWLDEVEARNEAMETMFDPTARIPQCELVRSGSAAGYPSYEG
jgi:hypothetical protein